MQECCFNCTYWRLYEPNAGGLVDMGLCAKHVKDRHDGQWCDNWVEMTEKDIEVRNIIRGKLLKNAAEMREMYVRHFKKIMIDHIRDWM